MTKLISSLFAAGLLSVSLGAGAMDNSMKTDKNMMKSGKPMMMDMKKMDTNGDGMISKDEFMKYHEAMYDGMQKNKDGMVDIKTMSMMHNGSMKSSAMMKSDGMAMGDKPKK